jgi:hypothetical protein
VTCDESGAGRSERPKDQETKSRVCEPEMAPRQTARRSPRRLNYRGVGLALRTGRVESQRRFAVGPEVRPYPGAEGQSPNAMGPWYESQLPDQAMTAFRLSRSFWVCFHLLVPPEMASASSRRISAGALAILLWSFRTNDLAETKITPRCASSDVSTNYVRVSTPLDCLLLRLSTRSRKASTSL